MSRRATTEDLSRLSAHGYKVEQWGNHGWVLRDPEGAQLQVEGYGGIAPTQFDAVGEGLRRIKQDQDTEEANRGH